MSSVRLEGIQKVFPDGGGVREFDAAIAEGEFFAFLGPSGCGKTTTLRIIAGLEKPSQGRVLIDGRDVTHEPPERRNAAMVFQNYALFPHMTVWDNVAFGPASRKLGKDHVKERVFSALELVRMSDLARRPVTELSGGQQQRVALARAIAVHPDVLLLDEPLSNLDAELRYATRGQLSELQRELGLTAVYVTHDQEEALELADRLAVMKDGQCHQIGTPREILEEPATDFVESFLRRQRASMAARR
jgi:iron(III) transport system ATP-binding protein